MVGAQEPSAPMGAVDVLLGAQLRRVRVQQGLSLHDVEDITGGEIKASVLGAYERGERSVSLTRLRGLADFYRVAASELLPPSHDAAEEEPEGQPRVVIDLVALEQHREQLPVLARYVDGVRSIRGDYQGRVLTVRSDDLRTLAAARGTTVEGLRAELAAARLVR